jgi:hypothetical protein
VEVGRGDLIVCFKFQPINIQDLNYVHLDMELLQLLNPLNAMLNPICYLLALLGTHPILHINKIRVNHLGCLILLRVCLAYELFECCVKGER